MRSAWALASMRVLEGAGWDWVHERAAELAAGLAAQLAERGLEVSPRGRSTLVGWKAQDADAEVRRLAQSGFVVRSIPSHGLIRASVGAWSSEDELSGLARAAAR
jgi:selenocysteine lyase/cysteine desulfurase